MALILTFFCSDTCTNAMAPDTNDRVSEATVNQASHRNDAGPSTARPANIAPIPGEKLGEGLYRKRALDRADDLQIALSQPLIVTLKSLSLVG